MHLAWRFTLVFLLLGLFACSSAPKKSSGLQTIKEPGQVKFSDQKSRLMYEILVAELAAERNYGEIAVKYYLSVAKESQDPEVAARAVRIASFAQMEKEALEAAIIWHNGKPDDPEAQRFLAVMYLRNNKIPEAQALFQQVLAEDKDRVGRNFLHLGSVLSREASPVEAFSMIRDLAVPYPAVAEAQYVVASLAVRADKSDIALQYADKTLAIRSDWIEAVVLRSRIMFVSGQVDEALAYLKKHLKKNPKQDEVRLNYAKMLVDARQLRDAKRQYELLAVKMPENEDILFSLAVLSLQFKELDEAEGYLLQLDRMGRRTPQVTYYLGLIAEERKRDQEAMDWYGLIRRGEFFLDAQLRIAMIISRTKSVDDALTHLDTVSAESVDDQRELVLRKGDLLKMAKRWQDAYDLYADALKREKNDVDYLYNQALMAERLDKVDEAVNILKAIVEEQPDNAAALNALGYTLADRTERYHDALGYVQAAMDLEPNDPAIIDSLGWVHFRLGNHKKALELLEKAMTLIEDGEVAAHYGEVLWVSGDKEKARTVWNKALENFGDNEILRSTVERFKP